MQAFKATIGEMIRDFCEDPHYFCNVFMGTPAGGYVICFVDEEIRLGWLVWKGLVKGWMWIRQHTLLW